MQPPPGDDKGRSRGDTINDTISPLSTRSSYAHTRAFKLTVGHMIDHHAIVGPAFIVRLRASGGCRIGTSHGAWFLLQEINDVLREDRHTVLNTIFQITAFLNLLANSVCHLKFSLFPDETEGIASVLKKACNITKGKVLKWKPISF